MHRTVAARWAKDETPTCGVPSEHSNPAVTAL